MTRLPRGNWEVRILGPIPPTTPIRAALIALVGFATLTLATSGIVAPTNGSGPLAAVADAITGRARPEARALARIPDAGTTGATVAGSQAAQAAVAEDDVADVVRSIKTVDEEIPYEVEKVADPKMYVGKSVVAQTGVPGLKRTKLLVRTAGPNVVDERPSSIRQVIAPTTQIIRFGTAPIPAPVVAPAPVYTGGSIQDLIVAAANRWGADANQLLRVAKCESGYNPNAYNASSGASGLFQFLATTWAANSVRAGYAGASPFDAVANANTAAMMFARGQAGQWVCK